MNAMQCYELLAHAVEQNFAEQVAYDLIQACQDWEQIAPDTWLLKCPGGEAALIELGEANNVCLDPAGRLGEWPPEFADLVEAALEE